MTRHSWRSCGPAADTLLIRIYHVRKTASWHFKVCGVSQGRLCPNSKKHTRLACLSICASGLVSLSSKPRASLGDGGHSFGFMNPKVPAINRKHHYASRYFQWTQRTSDNPISSSLVRTTSEAQRCSFCLISQLVFLECPQEPQA